MTALTTALLGFAATAALTPIVRRWALTKSLLDIPNERSSHTRPTPRGGGLGIVLVVLSGTALLGAGGHLDPRLASALLGGGALVATVGWFDDRRGVRASVRLAVHIAAAVWALGWLGGMPALLVGRDPIGLGAAGTLLAGAVIVWAINITNFMDGIDGLAASEVALVCFGAAALAAGVDPGLAGLAALVGGAALGFLPWNWQPARIFMGDVGSGCLGFVLAVLAIASERTGTLPALVWLVLYGVFAFDGTVTVLRRALRGERWYAAHRSHAYQRAVQAGYSHGRVTGTVVAIDLVLFLVAAWMTARPELLLPGVVVAVGVCGAAYGLVERRRAMPRLPEPEEGQRRTR